MTAIALLTLAPKVSSQFETIIGVVVMLVVLAYAAAGLSLLLGTRARRPSGVDRLFGIGALVDIIMIATENFTDDNNRLIVQDSRKNPNYGYAYAGNASAGGTKSSREDVLDQIEKLAKLRDSGAITQEEYDAKKAILMAQI